MEHIVHISSKNWLIFAYFATGCAKKHKNMFPKFRTVRTDAPTIPPGDAAEQFNMDAQLHSFYYATASEVGFALYWLWCTQTYTTLDF